MDYPQGMSAQLITHPLSGNKPPKVSILPFEAEKRLQTWRATIHSIDLSISFPVYAHLRTSYEGLNQQNTYRYVLDDTAGLSPIDLSQVRKHANAGASSIRTGTDTQKVTTVTRL